MRHRVGSFFDRDIDLPLGDQRPGDRSAEQIGAFVDRIGAQHRENIVLDEFFAQVADNDFARAGLERFLFNRLKILALAEVGAEGDHLAAVFLL